MARVVNLRADELANSVVTLSCSDVCGDIHISKIELTAGWETQPCTFPLTIQAGQSYRLQLKQTAMSEDPERDRKAQTVSLLVHSDDPVRPTLTAALKVDRTPPLTVYDSKIDFGEGEQETLSSRSRSFYVHYRGEPGQLYVEPGEQWLRAELAREDYRESSTWKDGSVDAIVRLCIDDASRLPVGPGETSLRIAVQVEGAPDETSRAGEVSIPVRVTLLGKVRAVPPELFLGILGPGGVASQSVSIVGVDAGDIRISSTAPERGVDLELIRGAVPGTSAELRCSVQSDLLPEGITEGKVLLTLGIGTQKELVVPYFVCVRK
jgi:hypothetical protein